MNRLKVTGIVLILTLGLGACREKSPKLVATPPKDAVKQTGNEVQTLSAKVDILFVIDDSGSMMSHQRNLSANIDKFLVGLQVNRFIDYHVGVISTSEEPNSWSGTAPGAGRLNGAIKYITKHTTDGMTILKSNLEIGTSGSATERVFSPVKLALTAPNLTGWNAGFYRPDAFLAVVIITDAEDQSEIDWGWPSRDPSLHLNAKGLYDFLVNLKRGNKKQVTSYGVIVPVGVPNSACSMDDPSTPARRIEEFINLTKGISYSLCDVDYGTKIANIGQDLVGRIGRSVLLGRRPVTDTIAVSYGSQVLESNARTGWSYDEDRNTVTFGREIVWTDQPEGTEVEVTFEPRE